MLSCMPRAGSRPHSAYRMDTVVACQVPSCQVSSRLGHVARPSRPGRVCREAHEARVEGGCNPPPCRSPTPPHPAVCAEGGPLVSLSLPLSLPPPPFPLIPTDTGLNTWRAPCGLGASGAHTPNGGGEGLQFHNLWGEKLHSTRTTGARRAPDLKGEEFQFENSDSMKVHSTA